MKLLFLSTTDALLSRNYFERQKRIDYASHCNNPDPNLQFQLRRERQLQRGGAATSVGRHQTAVGDPGRVRQHHESQPLRGQRGHRRPRPLDRGNEWTDNLYVYH